MMTEKKPAAASNAAETAQLVTGGSEAAVVDPQEWDRVVNPGGVAANDGHVFTPVAAFVNKVFGLLEKGQKKVGTMAHRTVEALNSGSQTAKYVADATVDLLSGGIGNRFLKSLKPPFGDDHEGGSLA